MATDHGGQQTMPISDTGSSIGGQSLETREEAMTGAWTVYPLQGAPQEVSGAKKDRERGARFYNKTTTQVVLRKVL